jgi:hypothetical protein
MNYDTITRKQRMSKKQDTKKLIPVKDWRGGFRYINLDNPAFNVFSFIRKIIK